jgi:hypothetical protein
VACEQLEWGTGFFDEEPSSCTRVDAEEAPGGGRVEEEAPGGG